MMELWIAQNKWEIYCNSQSAIHLAINQVIHERIKHVDVKLHFIKENIERGKVCISKIGTQDNPTDMFPKVIPTVKFEECLQRIEIEGS